MHCLSLWIKKKKTDNLNNLDNYKSMTTVATTILPSKKNKMWFLEFFSFGC